MTDRQRERRARKSRLFFAKRALAAGLEGNQREMIRLYTAALRKGMDRDLAKAVQLATGPLPLAA